MTLREQLIRDEGGFQLRPYRCSAGKLTIGVGHNLDDKPISRRAAEALFEDDLADVEAAVAALLPWSSHLDEVRRGVLLNMGYNMGVGKLVGFKAMLAAVKAGDWNTAARELLDSRYAGQVGQRATRLAHQLVTGAWQ